MAPLQPRAKFTEMPNYEAHYIAKFGVAATWSAEVKITKPMLQNLWTTLYSNGKQLIGHAMRGSTSWNGMKPCFSALKKKSGGQSAEHQGFSRPATMAMTWVTRRMAITLRAVKVSSKGEGTTTQTARNSLRQPSSLLTRLYPILYWATQKWVHTPLCWSLCMCSRLESHPCLCS